jgi:hypothetical protein
MAGVKSQIQSDLAARLRTVTTANGYSTDIQNVFEDDIPMGMDLMSHEVPAVLILNGKDTPKHEHQWIQGNWLIHLQLIHRPGETDETMKCFVGDVNKAIFADSPTLKRNDKFRSLGKSTQWHLVLVDPDVNMIDVNRFTEIVYEVQYHCHLTEI